MRALEKEHRDSHKPGDPEQCQTDQRRLLQQVDDTAHALATGVQVLMQQAQDGTLDKTKFGCKAEAKKPKARVLERLPQESAKNYEERLIEMRQGINFKIHLRRHEAIFHRNLAFYST